MRRLIGAGLLLAAFLALPLADVHAQKNKKTGPVKTSDSASLSAGQYSGTVKTVPGSDRTFMMTIEIPRLTPTGGGRRGNANVQRVLQMQNRIRQLQVRIRTARTPAQAQSYARQIQSQSIQLRQAVARMQLSGAGSMQGVRVSYVKQDVEFQASEKAKVRMLQLPKQYDDKGFLKEYSKEEKALLKGKDRNLVGYESSLEKLEPGQKITVTLAAAPRAPANDRELEDNPSDKKMQVKLVVIQEEAPAGYSPKEKPKRKKK